MTDDIGLLDWIFKGFAALCMAIIGFFTRKVVNDVHELQDDSKACELKLANYKTEVSNTYAKEETMQNSLARVHDKMEKIGDKIDRRMDQIQEDIKLLIGKVKP